MKFRRRNPDYSFFFFDDEKMAEYMRTRYRGQPILDVFLEVRVPAAKADIWRYCVLHREGGVYCDIDSALSIPLRKLLKDNPSETISFESNKWRDMLSCGKYADAEVFLSSPPVEAVQNLAFPDHVVLNWLLCFEKESPILEEVINLIVRHFAFFRNKDFDSIWKAVIHCTGPLALTQAVWMWVHRTNKRPVQCGIDFAGDGVFKLPGSGLVYESFPHFSHLPKSSLTY